jgi:hypothetical protein
VPRERKRESNPSCSHNAELKRAARAEKGEQHDADGRAVESVRALRAQQAWENAGRADAGPLFQAYHRPPRLRFWVSAEFSHETELLERVSNGGVRGRSASPRPLPQSLQLQLGRRRFMEHSLEHKAEGACGC